MGADNHQLTSIPIVTAGGVSQSLLGPDILIFNQYVHNEKRRSIHSLVQLESLFHEVDDTFIKLLVANNTSELLMAIFLILVSMIDYPTYH